MGRTMRRLGRVTTVAIIAAGCATSTGVKPGDITTTTPATTTTIAEPTTTTEPSPYGGTAVIGVGDGSSPRTLNPFLEGPDLALLDLMSPALFARGWVADPVTGVPVPVVLDAVPSLENGLVVDNGDGTIEVTAEVRDGAVWADGVPISGDDLAFTVSVATDPDYPIRSDVADLYALVVPGSIRPSGRGVTLRMQASTAYASLFGLILPRHAVAGSDFASDWNDTVWVGGGPFLLDEFIPGQLVSLVRNPAYWERSPGGDALPYLDRLIFRFYEPDEDADPRVLDAFTIGDLDLVTIASAQERADPYRDLDGVQVETAPGRVWEVLSFQFGPGNRNPLSQNRYLDLRRAVAHAIDRDALAVARGTAPVTSVLGRFGLGETEVGPWSQYPYDLDEVDARLDALGDLIDLDPFAGNGLDVSLTVPADSAASVATAGRVVTMLRAAGLDAELQLEESVLFFGPTFDNGSWDVASWGLIGSPGTAAAASFMTAFDPDGLPFVGTNYFRWGTIDSVVSGDSIERYRSLVDELRVEIDPSAAEALMVEMEQILADEVVIIPLVVRDDTGVAWWSDRLDGPLLNAFGGIAWNVASWRRTR
ncbi:MAG: hypothetical protein HZA58_03870 [Acidimicrobiia bacterium]|nr:hypothetical protein [Acidimicrobiia bacterium]